MRAPTAIVVALLLAALAGGCGKQGDSTPVACREGSGAYLAALATAPGKVALDGDTTISECLAENQQGGDLAAVGTALVAAATRLNAAARAQPSGQASVELGYLVGAAQRGAERTEGIHADLVRRLTVAARYAPGREPLPAAFLAAYRRGFDAGRAGG
jgi:hypothetical protein